MDHQEINPWESKILTDIEKDWEIKRVKGMEVEYLPAEDKIFAKVLHLEEDRRLVGSKGLKGKEENRNMICRACKGQTI